MSKISGDVWRFVGLAILASVAYGIAHDLVTANVAVTYFTVYHPKIVESQSPWVMAFLWGFLATWWFGLFSGIAVSFANILGKLPSAPWPYLRGRLVKGLILCWALAMLVLGGTYGLTRFLPAAERKPSYEADSRLVAVATTHAFSYLAGAVLTALLITWAIQARIKLSKGQPPPRIDGQQL